MTAGPDPLLACSDSKTMVTKRLCWLDCGYCQAVVTANPIDQDLGLRVRAIVSQESGVRD